MTTPAESAPRPGSSLATHLVPLRRNSGWLMAAGIALVILGIVGLGAVAMLSLASRSGSGR